MVLAIALALVISAGPALAEAVAMAAERLAITAISPPEGDFDGKPKLSPTVKWSKASGPGTVA